jgi:hypothetical protein
MRPNRTLCPEKMVKKCEKNFDNKTGFWPYVRSLVYVSMSMAQNI